MNTQQITDGLAKIISDAEKIISDASKMIETIDAGGPALPKEASQELAAGICLRCKKPMTKAEKKRKRRGCHERCYAANMRAIQRGETTEIALINNGHMKGREKGGRPKTPPVIKLPDNPLG